MHLQSVFVSVRIQDAPAVTDSSAFVPIDLGAHSVLLSCSLVLGSGCPGLGCLSSIRTSTLWLEWWRWWMWWRWWRWFRIPIVADDAFGSSEQENPAAHRGSYKFPTLERT